jgi:hypothetical protein
MTIDKIMTSAPHETSPFKWRAKVIIPRPSAWRNWARMIAAHELKDRRERWSEEMFDDMAEFIVRFYSLNDQQPAVCKGCSIVTQHLRGEPLYCQLCKTGKHMVTISDLGPYW